MGQFVRRILTRLSSHWMQRRSEPRPSFGGAVDWLPPVLGPSEWSLGLMADIGVRWYFDRDRS